MRISEREAWTLVERHVRPGEDSPSSFYDKKRIAMVLAPVLEAPHRVVVEVGSGYGGTTQCLSKMDGVALAVGMDADRALILKSLRPGYPCSFVEANAEKGLPFRTASVDAMIASEVYEHLFHPEAFFQEARRVLRPGGRLVLTTPNAESLVLMFLRRIPRAWARRILTREAEYRKYLHPEFFGDTMADSVHGHRVEGAGLREMERLARRFGFRQVQGGTWGLPFSMAFWARLPRRLRRFLMDRFHLLAAGLRHVIVVWERDAGGQARTGPKALYPPRRSSRP